MSKPSQQIRHDCQNVVTEFIKHDLTDHLGSFGITMKHSQKQNTSLCSLHGKIGIQINFPPQNIVPNLMLVIRNFIVFFFKLNIVKLALFSPNLPEVMKYDAIIEKRSVQNVRKTRDRTSLNNFQSKSIEVRCGFIPTPLQ